MNYSKMLVAASVALLMHLPASAQVYESVGADGVPDFSDSPEPGAEVVDIPSTNLMDAPPAEAAPAAPGPQQAESFQGNDDAGAGQGEGDGEGVDYYGGDDENVRAQRRQDEERIEHVIPGNVDHGVMGPGPGPETLPAESGVAEGVRPVGGEGVQHEGGRR